MKLCKISKVYLVFFVMGFIDSIHHKYTVTADSSGKALKIRKIRDMKENEIKSSEEGKVSMLHLNMKLPPMEDGTTDPANISKMHFELTFDDGTPPSKMTINDPNLTWVGDKDHKMSILQPVLFSTMEPQNLTIVNMKATPTLPLAEAVIGGSGSCPCSSIDSLIEELKKSGVILKGDKGERGMQGLSIQGERGPVGPPGYCSRRDCEFSGSSEPRARDTVTSETPRGLGVPPESLYKIVPGALVFPTRRAMLQMKQFSFIGTVAFVESDEIFYGRVKNGWRSFTMGSRVHRNILSTPNYPEQLVQERAKPSTLNTNRKPTPESYQNDNPTFQGPKSQSNHYSNTDLIVNHKPIKQTRLIGLNAPMTGNMGGINQVNYQCQRQAMKTNLHGIFRAMLSLSFSGMKSLVVNLNNETVFKENDKSRGKLVKDINIYSFNGRKINFNGGSRMGSVWGVRTESSNSNAAKDCQSWTSNSPIEEGAVYNMSDFIHESKSSIKLDSCDKKHTVLCIEILHMSQVNLRHRNSNRVRLSFEKYLAVLQNYDDSLLLS